MYNEVFWVTLIVFISSFLLSAVITSGYLKKRRASMLFWSLGMWLFAAASAIEVVFSAGVFTEFYIDLYLYIVAVLVQLLSIGSLLLARSRKVNLLYMFYAAAADVFLVYAMATTTIGNIIQNGVVFGALPMMITVGSSLITFPAAIILVVVSAFSYRKTRNRKLLSVIVGTVVLSAAGALYIVSFPAFLYIAELAGIILLWAGFVDFSILARFTGVKRHVNG